MDTAKRLNKVEELKLAKDGFDVLQDLLHYSEVGDYDAIPEDDVGNRFKWFGIYRQKPNTGHFMVRIKLPGGQVSPRQLRAIGELTDRYARGIADITTRQDIQLHWLTLSDLKPLFQTLWDIGLTTQFGCGDCPRNIVGCPLAGVLKDEIIDSSQHLLDVHNYYIQAGREFSNLPRKFKPSIGGCSLHCHQPQINDWGLYGVKRPTPGGTPGGTPGSSEVGYGLLVGGGLSATPHYGQPMRVFVRPDQVLDVARAVATLFRDYGYREKRTRARLKFLVADQGWQWTRDKLEEILGYPLEHDDSLLYPPSVHADHMGIGEQKDGHYYVGVPVERGRWTAQQMIQVADFADRHAVGPQRIRLTGKQNFLLLDVPKANIDALAKDLDAIGLLVAAHSLRQSLVSCTGSEFCNLAIVETKARAGRILKYLEETTEIDQPLMISISGCPNACAQYQIADIGLTGSLADDPDGRLNDKGRPIKVDAYNVLLAGQIGSDPRFGEVVAKKVVADRVHLSIRNLIEHYLANRIDDAETFAMWVSRHEPEHLQKLIVEPTEHADAVSLTA